MNVFSFTGHLGRDAETRTTHSGKSVTTFRVAIDTGYGERKGTLWVECALWDKRGASLKKHLTQGLKIAASGELVERSWEDREGQKRTALTVNVHEIDFMTTARQAREPAQDEGVPF